MWYQLREDLTLWIRDHEGTPRSYPKGIAGGWFDHYYYHFEMVLTVETQGVSLETITYLMDPPNSLFSKITTTRGTIVLSPLDQAYQTFTTLAEEGIAQTLLKNLCPLASPTTEI